MSESMNDEVVALFQRFRIQALSGESWPSTKPTELVTSDSSNPQMISQVKNRIRGIEETDSPSTESYQQYGFQIRGARNIEKFLDEIEDQYRKARYQSSKNFKSTPLRASLTTLTSIYSGPLILPLASILLSLSGKKKLEGLKVHAFFLLTQISLVMMGIPFLAVDLLDSVVRGILSLDLKWRLFRKQITQFLSQNSSPKAWIFRSQNLGINPAQISQIFNQPENPSNINEVLDVLPSLHRLNFKVNLSESDYDGELKKSPFLIDWVAFRDRESGEPILALMIRSTVSMPKFKKPKTDSQKLWDLIRSGGWKPAPHGGQ